MAKSYEDIGLNDKLQATNSIPTRRRIEPFNPPTDFESQVERGAITRSKMGTIDADLITGGTMSANYITGGTMSFNRSEGGTLVLGGTNDQSGVFSLKDEGGTEKILMNKTGMTINDGEITIKDEGGTAFIDSKGLVSTRSFDSGGTSKTTDQNITSTSMVDVTSLSITLNLARVANILIMANVTGYHYDTDGVMSCQLAYNGTTIGPRFVGGVRVAMAQVSQTGGVSHIYSAPAGAGTIKVQARQNNSPGTAVVEASFLNSTLNYVILGK